ncbi:hypothetical protein VTO73DRAFT_15114 [Trametes versicolor]
MSYLRTSGTLAAQTRDKHHGQGALAQRHLSEFDPPQAPITTASAQILATGIPARYGYALHLDTTASPAAVVHAFVGRSLGGRHLRTLKPQRDLQTYALPQWYNAGPICERTGIERPRDGVVARREREASQSAIDARLGLEPELVLIFGNIPPSSQLHALYEGDCHDRRMVTKQSEPGQESVLRPLDMPVQELVLGQCPTYEHVSSLVPSTRFTRARCVRDIVL